MVYLLNPVNLELKTTFTKAQILRFISKPAFCRNTSKREDFFIRSWPLRTASTDYIKSLDQSLVHGFYWCKIKLLFCYIDGFLLCVPISVEFKSSWIPICSVSFPIGSWSGNSSNAISSMILSNSDCFRLNYVF